MVKKYAGIVLVAYVISKVIMTLFGFDGLDWNQFKVSALAVDIVIWLVSWSISYLIWTNIFKNE